ncbi:MAG: helix-turn-helix transcriptional regulator [Bacillus sp. (in: firmicutes)]
MIHVHLHIEDAQEKQKIQEWLTQSFFTSFIVNEEKSLSSNDIVLIEVKSLLDWVKIRRMKKLYNRIIIFPLLEQHMIKTAPLAVELQLSSFFIKPVKRNTFHRHFKRLAQMPVKTNQSYDAELFWRKILKGEYPSNTELSRQLPAMTIPNLVCVMQGWISQPHREKEEGWEASSIIQNAIQKATALIGCEAVFVPFHKHAALLLKVPSEIVSPSFWKAGEEALLQTIQFLKEDYGIQLYIGAGSLAREVLHVKESYENAKVARRTVAKHQLSLRYFDEIPTNISVQKSVDYIQDHYTESISMNEVAAMVNFSPAYFSRMFKKETGHSFVSYVTLVRILRSIWLLRRTDQAIEQIAMDLGFNTPNYFSATFKKEIGLSPSQYRVTKEILFSHNGNEDDF